MRLVCRCDASLSIGSGHVLRCRNLARDLQRRDADVLFLCREQLGDLIALLPEEFGVMTLPALPGPKPEMEARVGRDLYGAWLGCSQQVDAEFFLNIIPAAAVGPIDWLVVDHYGLDQAWERSICEGLSEIQADASRLLAFDDLDDRPHQADVLVDANRFDASAWDAYLFCLFRLFILQVGVRPALQPAGSTCRRDPHRRTDSPSCSTAGSSINSSSPSSSLQLLRRRSCSIVGLGVQLTQAGLGSPLAYAPGVCSTGRAA